MLGKIKKEILKLFPVEWGVRTEDLVAPPDQEMGDLSFPCFELAKKFKKNPAEAVKELESRIMNSGPRIIEKAKAVGPYLNFTLKTDVVAEAVFSEIKKRKNKIGEIDVGKKQRILIEYPSNNTHKEVHVGHLRNVCLGNALVGILTAAGTKVIPVNYINDFGAHVAKCLWGLEKFHSQEKPPENKQRWLGQIYAAASRYLKNHPEAEDEVEDYLGKLEKRDKKVWKLFMTTRKWSLDGFGAIFKELDVRHKVTFYEKDVKETGQRMVDELLEKNIAQVGEGGAIIVDLKNFGLDIGLLRKSNGSGLYLTSDLGLARIKAEKFPDVEESINLTGAEQNFYFRQLFKILELAGFKYKMIHVSYELVNLPEGKMSSRLGNVVLYEEIRDEALALAERETKKRHPEWTSSKVKRTARHLSLGALKFSMLKVGPRQVITFNPKEALSFDGFTGPYLQYSLARMNSLLKKCQMPSVRCPVNPKNQNSELKKIFDNKFEKRLLFKLAKFDEAIKISAERKDPSQLARYLYETSQFFSNFYENCPVERAENVELKRTRLELVRAAKIFMEKGLQILGIPIIKEM